MVAADVSREDDCSGLVAACLERHGRVDVLHHNVGIAAGDGWTEDLDIEAWERIMRVNAGSAALLAKAVVPPMRDQGAGAITNVSSIAAVCATITRLGNPPLGYKMSKAALNALTQSLAQTYAGDGIRVNAILPGLIDTPMGVDAAAREFGLDRDRYAAVRDETVPLKGGMGSAWDVANAAVFLASDEARFVTGVLLPVDGGQSTPDRMRLRLLILTALLALVPATASARGPRLLGRRAPVAAPARAHAEHLRPGRSRRRSASCSRPDTPRSASTATRCCTCSTARAATRPPGPAPARARPSSSRPSSR